MERPLLKQRLAGLRHIALDLDGTIYRDNRLFDCTQPFLRTLDQLGLGYTFVTNNSSRSRSDYLLKLRSLGITATAEQVLISTHATISWLAAHLPQAKVLNVLGNQSLREEFRAAGYRTIETSDQGEPDAVVVGFDTEIAYDRLCATAYWIAGGRPYLATHPDLVCPTDQKTILVDCGALCACLESVTGRVPDVVPGKPNPLMLEPILSQHQVKPEQVAIIGDRLYTDMEMARQSGAVGILVLTGEATKEQAELSSLADLVVDDLADFAEHLLANRAT